MDSIHQELRIGGQELSECEWLETVTLKSGSKLAALGYKTFSACKKLPPSIHLPSSLKVITGYYFACSRELREITFEANSALE
jgi:hypothetical protein